MTEPTPFQTVYFEQTRKEIESDSRERDVLLHLTIIVLGGGAFFVVGQDGFESLTSVSSLGVVVPALVLIDSLMWVRREKLRQMAERWQVLERLMAECFGTNAACGSFERLVVVGMRNRRYGDKDFVLKFALSVSFYLICFAQVASALSKEQDRWRVVVVPLVFLIDVAVGFWLLYRPVLGDRSANRIRLRKASNPSR